MTGQYPDIPYIGPPRSYNSTSYPKRYITIHNTSNTASAEGEAGYATRRTDGTSSHYYVDHDSLVQSLHTDLGANHVGSLTGNRHGISYEITGVNGWTRAQWLANVQWPLLARQIARDCRRHGIAVQLLTVAQMRDGRTTGVITHDLARQAWGGTDHTDPGPNFPMDYLLSLVRAQISPPPLAPEEIPMTQHVMYYDNAPGEPRGGLRIGDFTESRAITAKEKVDFETLAKAGALDLHPTVWPDRGSTRSFFGTPVEDLASAEIDYGKLAEAILANLPEGLVVPTAEQNAEATADELLDRLQG